MKKKTQPKIIENHEIYERVPYVQSTSDKYGDGFHYYGLTAPPKDSQWFGSMPIPKRGDKILVNFNSFGVGTVRGYFVEYGYLGLYVEPDNPPAWWIKQHEDAPKRCCMVFGPEVREIENAVS